MGLRTFPTDAQARTAHREGVLRLLLLALPSPAKAVQDRLANDAKLLLARAPHGNAGAVFADAAHAAAAQLLDEAGGAEVRTAEGFEQLLAAVRPRFTELTATAVDRTLRVLRTAAAVEKNISRTSSLTLVPSLADVREQFTGLVHAGFVAETGIDRLPDLLRYLQGIDRRLATMPDDPSATGCGWPSSPGSATRGRGGSGARARPSRRNWRACAGRWRSCGCRSSRRGSRRRTP